MARKRGSEPGPSEGWRVRTDHLFLTILVVSLAWTVLSLSHVEDPIHGTGEGHENGEGESEDDVGLVAWSTPLMLLIGFLALAYAMTRMG